MLEANLTAFVPPVVAAGLTVAELKESLGAKDVAVLTLNVWGEV